MGVDPVWKTDPKIKEFSWSLLEFRAGGSYRQRGKTLRSNIFWKPCSSFITLKWLSDPFPNSERPFKLSQWILGFKLNLIFLFKILGAGTFAGVLDISGLWFFTSRIYSIGHSKGVGVFIILVLFYDMAHVISWSNFWHLSEINLFSSLWPDFAIIFGS
jgi:hypothetical protein